MVAPIKDTIDNDSFWKDLIIHNQLHASFMEKEKTTSYFGM